MVNRDITKLLNICLNQNYFEFNNKMYVCKEGLAMGNLLSPLSAELFMNNFELKIKEHPYFKLFKFWYKYVDDVLALFLGTKRQLNTFLNFINSLHSKIGFTMEFEENNKINFLDLTIKKHQNKLKFEIFHKPTHIDTVIHNSSAHPFANKLAAFHSYIHRLINVPLSDSDFQKELNIIKQIAVNNGYVPSLIEQILSKKLYSKLLRRIFPVQCPDNKKF